MTEVLKRIYYDESHPASFGGVEKLWRAAKKDSPGITRKTVERWLSGQDQGWESILKKGKTIPILFTLGKSKDYIFPILVQKSKE